jgi:hypothetical protein
MLQTTNEEKEVLEDSAQEFFTLAIDTVDKQESQVIKTQGAKMLEALCDYIDGSVTFATVFTLDALAFGAKKFANPQT